MSKSLQNPDAFVDIGYPDGDLFCEKFLSSPEFTSDLLKEINKKFDVEKRSYKKDKEGYAQNLAQAIRFNELSKNNFLLEYVKKPKTWLSFKLGSYLNCPTLNNPENLLTQFGVIGWYGPIKESNSSKVWYVKIHKFDHCIPREAYIDIDGKTKSSDIASIRWPVIAEVDEKYLAIHWDGFSRRESPSSTKNQLPFWLYIPKIFEELQGLLTGNWEHPPLHKLLLHDLLDKYNKNNNSQYHWSHKRVRAKASGIDLNVHSSSDEKIDIDDQGLKGLSHTLAEVVLESLDYQFPYNSQILQKVETDILHTLIREWGTKSYEFKLTKKLQESNQLDSDINKFDVDLPNKNQNTTLFRAHCYFGLNSSLKGQDSLQHLMCYKECNFSVGVLKFLLDKLGIN